MLTPRLRWIAIALAVVVAALALLGAIWWLVVGGRPVPHWDAPTVSAIAIIAAAALLVLPAVIWWVRWRLPQRQVAWLALKIRDPKARADVLAALVALLWAIWWLWPPMDSRTVLAIAIAVLALLAVICWVWWRLPQFQLAWLTPKICDTKARADTEDNFRKTVGQALGGAAVLIGVGVAYLQFTQQQQTSRDQLQAAHDLLISNQVSKGFEQLAGGNAAGDDKIVMRLGGIYALQGVMNNSAQYHQPVLDTLCAFVRDKTTGKTDPQPATDIDIQAALTVIGNRVEVEGSGLVDLHGANLSGANLATNLRGADLTSANLSGADLTFAHLEGADLTSAALRDTDLLGAHLDGTDLSHDNLGEVQHGSVAQEQVARACGTDVTLPPDFPPGFSALKPCPRKPWPRGGQAGFDLRDRLHSNDSYELRLEK